MVSLPPYSIAERCRARLSLWCHHENTAKVLMRVHRLRMTENRRHSDWILGSFLHHEDSQAVGQGPREFLHSLSLQVFQTQPDKALSNLTSFRADPALARLFE